jgi:NADPH:quinone reductase-like Zn-dependent oxidoreductase
MTKAIRIHQTGGPEVLKWEDVDVPAPKEGEARIRHTAVGLNYIDTYHRSGLYPVPMPAVIGGEGAGVVEAVGPGVTDIKVGDRVAYGNAPIGSYAEQRIIPAGRLVKIPDGISDQQAASMMLKGLTTQYLIRTIYRVQKGDTILMHAAAGGVGLIVGQWAKLLGLTIIGTVSSEAKAELARAHGYDHIIRYDHEDVPSRVRELTGGAGAAVVYDSVGKDTFAGSLASLKRRGLLVCVGTASGPIPPIDALQLAIKGSLYVTRPALADYIADPAERAALAGELFDHVAAGRIRIEINQRYRLEDAVQAHRDLEARKTTGSSIFVI